MISVYLIVIQGAAYYDKSPKVEKASNYTENHQNKLVYILSDRRTYHSWQKVASEYC